SKIPGVEAHQCIAWYGKGSSLMHIIYGDADDGCANRERLRGALGVVAGVGDGEGDSVRTRLPESLRDGRSGTGCNTIDLPLVGSDGVAVAALGGRAVEGHLRRRVGKRVGDNHTAAN